MARKGKEIASASTPSRARSTKNSNRGRGKTFSADRFDNQIHYDRWRALERRGYVHEQIIRLLRARVLGLGWGFMHNPLVRINVTMEREFWARKWRIAPIECRLWHSQGIQARSWVSAGEFRRIVVGFKCLQEVLGVKFLGKTWDFEQNELILCRQNRFFMLGSRL
ncbi:hypothetical protein PIB30_081039 [Stylosanthes scabra]|uniref:Uncharacterized protein n=1 Tax=Stylosanthes scabra TaxID=79078 RepID=A0ABU6WUZ5_9FABA|nr:hypothetical protein [Stylosanthes scabra]